MPRVLLITFVYPPTEIIGAVRPAALAKYLPRFGWEPIILTPKVEPSRGRTDIIETGYRDIMADWKSRLGLDGKRSVHDQLGLAVSSRPGSGLLHSRAIDLAKYFMGYPDDTKGWVPFAMQAIEEIRRQGPKIDAILTTSPPISAHLIGRKAKAALGCPWVADLRDLWTQNLANAHPRLDSLQIGLEKRTLGAANALVTVSDPWAAKLRNRHPSKQVLAITNGFDPEHFAPVSKELTAKFTITYAGLLYQGRRDPSLLFEVLRELCDEKLVRPEDVRVRFYGPIEPWVTALVQQYRLEEAVEIHGVVSRNQALQRQAESQVLLMLGWTDPRETGQHSGKLFEYLGAARPILAVGGSPSVLTDTLNETGAGTHAFSKADVRNFLIAAYGEFTARGYVPYHADGAVVGQYTHLQMSRRFAEVLDRVSGRPVPAETAAASLAQANRSDSLASVGPKTS